MLRHTVGYAIGCVTLPIVLVLSLTTAVVMWPTRSLLPFARVLGRGDDFSRWSNRTTERLMDAAGVPLRLTGWIIGSHDSATGRVGARSGRSHDRECSGVGSDVPMKSAW